MTWLTAIAALIKLLSTVFAMAAEARQRGAGRAEALVEVITDALATIQKARAARADVDAADAAGGLRDDDGHRRD